MAKRQIKYTNRDFDSIINDIGNYAKQYFPDYFNKFNSEEYSVEKLISELVAYQSDILNYMIDDRYNEMYIQYANESGSVFRNAKRLGYKPQTVSVAIGDVEFSQLVPSKFVDGDYIPDTDSAGVIKEGSKLTNNSGDNVYTVVERCDMKNYTRSVVDQKSGDNASYFRIYNLCKVRSGKSKRKTIAVSDPVSYRKILVDENVAFVESVVDSEGNKWYEVDYLAQDYVFEKATNDGSISDYDEFKDVNPYILKIQKTSRRFIVDHNSDGRCYLMFGAGRDVINDDLQKLSAYDILSNNEISNLNISSNIVGDNFTNSDSYGLSPYNTTLTITYVVSQGQAENVKPNNITNISNLILEIDSTDDVVTDSFEVNNTTSISGAEFKNNLEKVRAESAISYGSQNRCVTASDFAIRSKIMPSDLGNVSKTFVRKSDKFSKLEETNASNLNLVNALDLYILSKGQDGYLETCNNLTKNNLRVYLDQYRMTGVGVNILDPFVINFAVKFDYSVRKNYVREEVLNKVFKVVESYFSIDKWEINQPILVEELKMEMFEVEGLASVTNINFVNKYQVSEGYNPVFYDMNVEDANFNKSKGILYPPKDIGIFELKYPKKNIIGRNV